VNTISSTVQRPNWSRPSPGCGPSKRVGFKVGGMNRFRGGKRNRPSRKKARYNYDNGRTLLFKSFNRPIGVSGVGYGTSLEHDNAECFTCCAVVGTDGTLITAYPILTQEALNRGQGPKTVFDEHPSIITDSDRTHDNVDQKINDRHNEERSREENNEK
uniref:Uncharacterized protein n=1 Tax=Romanomermis culicivorax TaxID=13658 RepID=A0A915JCT7_ROMCU